VTSLTRHLFKNLASPENENSVFSKSCVIYFIWSDDENSSKTCQWWCAYYTIVKKNYVVRPNRLVLIKH